jgi:hypothetical protein
MFDSADKDHMIALLVLLSKPTLELREAALNKRDTQSAYPGWNIHQIMSPWRRKLAGYVLLVITENVDREGRTMLNGRQCHRIQVQADQD